MMTRFAVLATTCLALSACGEGAPESAAPTQGSETPAAPVEAVAPLESAEDTGTVTPAGWSRNAAIYQINTRQFTADGTFAAAQEQLPRIADMGIDIIWLMPVHPIGAERRKGSLGSPYAVQDYYGVNPEFGTLEDLRAFIDAAHALEMRVILDWVANHSAWDNDLVTEQADWYTRDSNGQMQHPADTDWTDVVDFDYDNDALRQYMIDVMAWWVEDVGVDGFRCDVAGMVPIDFWNDLRVRLDEIKPVFMLAEWETADHHERAFEATYAWTWNNLLHDITVGEGDATAADMRAWYFDEQDGNWPQDGYRLTYVANHDQNAWHSNMFDRFGDGLEAAIALSVVGEGVPMVYNGQEAGNAVMLEFFERDPIVWGEHALNQTFTDLFALLETNEAIWHGASGGQMVPVTTGHDDQVLAFTRHKGDDAVLALFNLSSEPVETVLSAGAMAGTWTRFGSGEVANFEAGTAVSLPAWSYQIYTQGG